MTGREPESTDRPGLRPVLGRLRGAGPLILLGLLAIWVVASASSRSMGFWLLVPVLAVFAWAVVGLVGGRPANFFRVLAVLVGLAAAALILEGILHLAPGILRGQIANAAYSGYHTYKGGIYTDDRVMGSRMRPLASRAMYWQGYWWDHETNTDGYRGVPATSAEAVFLGDSTIYGHGVEVGQTVPARFELATDQKTVNLGQQGLSLVQSLARLRELGLTMRPETVFVATNITDLSDLTFWYSEEELAKFVSSDAAAEYQPTVRESFWSDSRWDLGKVWADHLALPLRVAGIVEGTVGVWVKRLLEAPEVTPVRVSVPGEERDLFGLEAEVEALELLRWRALRRAMLEIRRAAESIGAATIFFDIGYPEEYSQAIERLAVDAGGEYSPGGREAFARSTTGEDIFLPNDGHWSPNGCAVVARGLASGALTPD